MHSLHLVIANKNYSSWSLRAWALMVQKEIKFNEIMLPFNSRRWDERITKLSPSCLVPVLWEGEPESGFCTNDTLAITERLNELFPDRGIWPENELARARARSLYAEFHSGFTCLRNAMPMNISAGLSGFGHTPDALREIETLCTGWESTKKEFGAGGVFLFGDFTAIDACYLPVVSRLRTYGIELQGLAKEYADALMRTDAMQQWTKSALAEDSFVQEDEPYRTSN